MVNADGAMEITGGVACDSEVNAATDNNDNVNLVRVTYIIGAEILWDFDKDIEPFGKSVKAASNKRVAFGCGTRCAATFILPLASCSADGGQAVRHAAAIRRTNREGVAGLSDDTFRAFACAS